MLIVNADVYKFKMIMLSVKLSDTYLFTELCSISYYD